ncbi:MAG: hypothetical protein GWP91_06410 [Rhodobacterales bacterium]|nr:hypothetical protein [Rhodobacterales bacterium]
MRAHLSGRLTSIWKDPKDRIVVLTIGSHQLVLRLTGRRGGLWLCTQDRVVAAYDGPAPPALPAIAPLDVPLVSPRFQPNPDEDWDRAAARYFTETEVADRLRQRRVQVSRRLRTDINRNRRLIRNLEQDFNRAADAPKYRRQADALAATLHTIKRGSTTAIAPDLEDYDRTWTIALDPNKPASHTLQRLYKKAGRMERRADQILDRLGQVEDHLERLSSALKQVGQADSAELGQVTALLPKSGSRAAPTVSTPWVTWTGPNGQEVWVGRNATGNRRLTFQKARGNDWWMHLRERPGAHIVIRMRREQTPSLELLLAVGQIASIHGKIAFGSSVDVQYTRVKNVRSIPGDAGGKVRLSDERVLRITRERESLTGWFTDAALAHGFSAHTH